MTPKPIPELEMLEHCCDQFRDSVQVKTLAEVTFKNTTFPLQLLHIGSSDKQAPTLFISASVHGLERIGTHIVLTFLQSLLQQQTWDKHLRQLLEQIRIITIPIVNPFGLSLNRRSNHNGVDLMRNAPVEAEGDVIPLLSGHYHSPSLPWYRGNPQKMERETQAIVDYFRQELFSSPHLISLDIHSGFGIKDRLWYPWAKAQYPFPHEKQAIDLFSHFEKVFPYHVYQFEPQNHSYRTHGDLWDFLYMEFEKLKLNPNHTYLPFTLEMGSWMWVKKNPWQIFSMTGLFHPVKKHRYARTMRRHLPLLNFLTHYLQVKT
jgi:hypothetical protein